ncbi:MAG: hypothetical protein ACI85I_001756 [Arenicella sp.]|jgi:hypothetical protein
MNYLLIGQGIAGTNLAFTLLERGKYFFMESPREQVQIQNRKTAK